MATVQGKPGEKTGGKRELRKGYTVMKSVCAMLASHTHTHANTHTHTHTLSLTELISFSSAGTSAAFAAAQKRLGKRASFSLLTSSRVLSDSVLATPSIRSWSMMDMDSWKVAVISPRRLRPNNCLTSWKHTVHIVSLLRYACGDTLHEQLIPWRKKRVFSQVCFIGCTSFAGTLVFKHPTVNLSFQFQNLHGSQWTNFKMELPSN